MSARIAPWADRLADVISAYDAQGWHRTGSAVDTASAEWLAGLVGETGLEPRLEDFPLDRIDVEDARVCFPGGEIAGVPLFDAPLTGEDGVQGQAGGEDATAGIAVIETSPAGDAPALEAARARDLTAVIAVTGGDDDVAPRNAPAFASPGGPPVIQVPPAALPAFQSAVRDAATVRVVTAAQRTRVDAWNVVADIPGSEPHLKPLVVMTPRSGWWYCASERGGGLACWLAAMESLLLAPPARTVHFVATSGHELGHLGLEDYIERRLELPVEANMWLHLGANIGAQAPGRLAVRAADPTLAERVAEHLAAERDSATTETLASPPGPVAGEAADIADHGGRFLSLVGGNDRFHLPSDRWPGAVAEADVAAVARVIAHLVQELANG